MSCYVVTRLEGHLEPVYGGPWDRALGVSFMVVDTTGTHSLMATYRSEDYYNGHTSRGAAWAQAERLANEHAARLNG